VFESKGISKWRGGAILTRSVILSRGVTHFHLHDSSASRSGSFASLTLSERRESNGLRMIGWNDSSFVTRHSSLFPRYEPFAVSDCRVTFR